MSEDKFHFRIKRGDVEIEYAGKSIDVATKFLETFEWLKTAPVPPTHPSPREGSQQRPIEVEKEERRGGARTSVISPAIDELVKEGFLNDFKSAADVLEELRRKTVPASGVEPVTMALNRRVPKTLDRIKDQQGKWVYRKKP